jgi:sugar lactone lactonase YvrE
VNPRSSSPLLLAAVVGTSVLARPSTAGVTSTWTVETYTQFDAGDAENAFITSLGELRPGWALEDKVELAGDGVWSSLRLASGTILIGSDELGAIYKVEGKKATKVTAIAGAIATVALVESGGAAYAGAMPSDKIWKLDVAGGKATAFATLAGAETVWSLAAAPDGTLYAGTGPEGKLWSIDRGGKPKLVFETKDKRITAVAVAPDGGVWFGTSERALVFRHDPRSGSTRAMADFAGNEIAAIAPVGGAVIVAANDLQDPPTGAGKTATQVDAIEDPGEPKGQPARMPDAGSKPGADKDTTAVEGARKGARKGKGALFRVDGEGRLEQLHALTQTYFTSLAIDPAGGAVYAAAADKGRIYLIEPDDTVATAFDVDERAVAQVFWDGKQLAFTTDDTAGLYRVKGKASDARYVSEVYDAKSPSRWGRIQWQGAGKVVVETRTGNTAKPDVGWSPWAAPTKVAAAGGDSASGPIASPPGRYLQFRVSLPDGGSVRRIVSYYLPQNSATSVEDVTVELASKESQPTLKDAGAKPRSPLYRVKWKIDNGDGDDTSYVLAVRREGDADWRTLQTGKPPLTATSWDWNTETFADGWYRLRVTSSDAMANSPDRALEASRTSTLFVIDNTRPTISGLTVRDGKASATVDDELSIITELAFAIDDGPWQLGTTVDGIFDSTSESIALAIPGAGPAAAGATIAPLARGTHTLSLRVADAAGNVGSSTTTFLTR